MSEYDAFRVATIILRHFHGHGGKGDNTMPFDELPTTVRMDIGVALQSGPDELPVIAHYQSQNDWSVLTTHRLVVRRGASVLSIPWSDFADFKVDLKAVESLPDPKDKLNELTVVTASGQNVTITTDRGRPFFAFWNSLIMAKRMAPEEERRRGR